VEHARPERGRHRLALPLFLYPLPFTGPASALFPSSPTPLRIRLRDVFTFPTIHRYGRQTENGKMMTFGRSLPSRVQKICFPGGRVAAAIDHLTGSRESTRGVGTNICRCHHGSYDDVQLKQNVSRHTTSCQVGRRSLLVDVAHHSHHDLPGTMTLNSRKERRGFTMHCEELML